MPLYEVPVWAYVLGSAVLVQLLKVVLYAVAQGRPSIRVLVAANGLPSAHAVVLACLATLVWAQGGIQNPAYNAVMIYGGIILHDAFKVKSRIDRGTQTAWRLAGIPDLDPARAFVWRERLNPFLSARASQPAHVIAGLAVGVLLGMLRVWSAPASLAVGAP